MKSKSIPIFFLSCCFLSLIVSCQHFRFVRPLKNNYQYITCKYGRGCLPNLDPPKSYKKYRIFRDKMSLEKLYEYAEHEDDIIKTYAYWALLEREKSSKIEALFGKMLQDTSKIAHMCGAIRNDIYEERKTYTAYFNYSFQYSNDVISLWTDTTLFEYYEEDADSMRLQAVKLQMLDSLVLLNTNDSEVLYRALWERRYSTPAMVERIIELAMRTESDGLEKYEGAFVI